MQQTNHNNITNFYSYQSKFYDMSRWLFLFQRKEILYKTKELKAKANSILDIGCGTGKSLKVLAQLYPESNITGIDLSKNMLNEAKKKTTDFNNITLINSPFPSADFTDKQFDIILFSYSLSMFNPGWSEAIERAYNVLSDTGFIVILDFHHSQSRILNKWMDLNHVKLDKHLLPKAESLFKPVLSEINPAYFSLWQYFLFIGKKYNNLE